MDRHGFLDEFALRLQMAQGVWFAAGAEPVAHGPGAPVGPAGRWQDLAEPLEGPQRLKPQSQPLSGTVVQEVRW